MLERRLPMEMAELQGSLPMGMQVFGASPAVPLDAEAAAVQVRNGVQLAVVSLPQTNLADMPAGQDAKLDLEESRSESSSKSSSLNDNALAGRGIAHLSMKIGPYPDNMLDDDDESLDDSVDSGKSGSGAGVMKRAWRPEEDAQLMALVTELGASHWSIIASYLEGRVGKQCRER